MPAADLWQRSVRRLLDDPAGVPDADLLARFRAGRDEAAFELLVYRHGPLVWAACRRLLTNRHDAEDAFQATFLALARRARSIRRAESVPAWLHRVAVRAAVHLARTRRPTAPPGHDPIDPAPGPADRASAADLAAHLDAAVNGLPDRLRRVFVACELHGDPLADVAARLRCPVGTVASRLARARHRLRDLLSARGATAGTPAGLTAVELVPPALRAEAVRAAAGTGVRPAVAALARRAGGRAWVGWTPALAAAVVPVAAVAALVFGAANDPPADKPPAKDPPAAARPAVADEPPLPAGALARVGSGRFRTDGWYFTGFAFSPDGRLIAGASVHRRLSVWEAATGRVVSTVEVEEGPFGQLAFTADGKHVAVGLSVRPQGQEVRCYEARTGRLVLRTGDGDFKVAAPWRVGPNDTLWVAGSAAKGVQEVRGLELPGGREVRRTRVPAGAALNDFTPDGSRLLLAADGRFTLHDAAAGTAVRALDAKGRRRVTAYLVGDGKRVATVEGDRLRLHDAAAGRVVADVRLSEDPRPVVTVPVSFPHARYAVARPHYRDGVDLVVIDLDRGRVGLNLPNFDAHGWAFSPDGRHLVTLHSGSGTLVWDLARPAAEPVARLPRGGTARFSPDGRVLAVDGHGCLALYDTATWRLLPQSASPVAAVRSVRFTPGGRGLVALTGDGWWEWADWSKPDARRLFGPADGHQSSASDLSADGQVVAEMVSALSLGPKAPPAAELRVTDRRTGKARTFPGARWASRDAVLSGDGRRVFTWLPEDSEVRGWDTATGDPLRTWPVAKTPQLEATLATSHDGKWVALFPETQGGSAGVAGARVWDVDGGREVSRIPGVAGAGPGDERTAEFSRDGRRLAAVVHTPAERPQTTVRVWDWRAGRQLMSAPVFFFLTAVTLSADGRACAVGEFDGRVRVFEVASGGERAAFRHGARVGAVALHPDGTRVAASSPEAPVYVWDLLPGPARWDPAGADAVWADLAADAKVAFAAMQALRANPAAAVEFLRGRSPLPPAPTDERVADLLKGLDAPAFAERERSQKELAAVIEWVRPKLEAARKAASEEAGRRLDQVLKPGDPPTADQLRQVRACEVLEALGTAEAAKLLRTWAGGPAGARLTAEAQESLDRLRN